MVRHYRREREIRAGVEWRIDVDQVHLAREFGQEGRQDVFLVAPDQPIAPLLLAKSRRELQAALAVLRRLVDRLDGLKRQRHAQGRHPPAGGVVLPVPNQFRARGSALRVPHPIARRRRLLRCIVHCW